ncbi:MAG TPA: SigE family RNA polymerase sigma factor [Acidimicrobiia bacterium]|jgi:RNA polymerase sigma-70 factor (sigma-E family)
MVERAEVGEAEAPVVSAVSDGPPAFEAEFDHLFAAAYRAAFRLLGDREEASDCAQEALTRAYPRWERLRRGEPASWVVRVAANLAIDRWRRQQRSDRSEPIAEAPHVDESVVTRAVLNAALAELPRRQREVVVLRYVGDFSEAQVASALGISPGAVKQHASRGLAALRNQLEDN